MRLNLVFLVIFCCVQVLNIIVINAGHLIVTLHWGEGTHLLHAIALIFKG